MLEVQPRSGGFSATLRIDPGFALFPDHFRSNPILPGICLVQAVLLAAARCSGRRNLRLQQLKNAKFMAPALPNDQVLIDAELAIQQDGGLLIKASLRTAEKKVAQLSLVARDDTPPRETEGRP